MGIHKIGEYVKVKLILLFLLVLSSVQYGCTVQTVCKPTLFPYSEYHYKAEPITLAGSHAIPGKGLSIDVFDLELKVPDGYTHEKVFPQTYKFTLGKKRLFILSMNDGARFGGGPGSINDIENFNFIGCNNIKIKDHEKTKTHKDFNTDLYNFTVDDLTPEPDFWQYFILWTKTEHLRDSERLVHFTANNLDAFQKSIDPRMRTEKSILTQIRIFPNKIAPNYISIAADFIDDAFFVEFLNMLNALNP